jgi:uncharacterized membrane protein YvbJ
MTCRACGAQIAEKAIVCYRCGAPTADPVVSTGKPVSRSRTPIIIAIVVIVAAIAAWVVFNAQ